MRGMFLLLMLISHNNYWMRSTRRFPRYSEATGLIPSTLWRGLARARCSVIA